MPNRRRSTRRRVCRLVGAAVAGIAWMVSEESTRAATRSNGGTDVDAASRFDVYPGVVDRIVDGTSVVVLLEEDGRVVDEIVVPRSTVPPVSESDRVIVVLEAGDVRCLVPISLP